MCGCLESEGRFDISLISAEFDADQIGRIIGMRVQRDELSDNGYDVFRQNAAALKKSNDGAQPKDASFEDLQAMIYRKKKQKKEREE